MRYPVDSPTIRELFGVRPWPVTGYHQGADYVAPTGTALYPIRAGTVSYINWNDPDMGNAIEIDIGGGFFTRYMHCSEILVAKGARVDESTIVAKAGYTGYVEPPNANGAHLHAELYTKNDKGQPSGYQDIDAFIKQNAGGGGGGTVKITLDTHRQIYYGILGRNGLAGRPNALNGSSDGEWDKNAELTVAYLEQTFLSPEARKYRDEKGKDSNYELQRRYDLVPQLEAQLEEAGKQRDAAVKRAEAAEKNVISLAEQNGQLATDLAKAKDANVEVNRANEILTNENERLKKASSELTISGHFAAAWKLILAKLGKGEPT